MTVVPLPDVPCVRCQLTYTLANGALAGSRFYLSYSGSAPSGANCTTLAGDISSQWGTHIAPFVYTGTHLTEVDVLDIASHSGLSGQDTTSRAGGQAGTALPGDVAVNVEFGIARRYRGGKPRMYFPCPDQSQLVDVAHWSSAFVSGVNTDVAAFFAAVNALSVGSMGTLQHVNLSYFHGFTVVTNTSGRARNAPNYKATATHDNITGYFCKALISSQDRRRKSTTP